MLSAVLARRMRLLTLGLAVLVAIGAWGTTFGRLLGGPPAHACHCETRDGHHAECACPVCFPEIGDVDALGHPSVTGTCGDQEHVARAPVMPGVTSADFVIFAAPLLCATTLQAAERGPPSWRHAPPDEPPKPLS